MNYDDGYRCNHCRAWYAVAPNASARAAKTWPCPVCPGRVRPERLTAYERWQEREISRLERMIKTMPAGQDFGAALRTMVRGGGS